MRYSFGKFIQEDKNKNFEIKIKKNFHFHLNINSMKKQHKKIFYFRSPRPVYFLQKAWLSYHGKEVQQIEYNRLPNTSLKIFSEKHQGNYTSKLRAYEV